MSENENQNSQVNKEEPIIGEVVTDKKPHLPQIPGKNGGVRPGSGRPKKPMLKEDKLRLKAERKLKRNIFKSASALLASQLALARGSYVLFCKEQKKSGKKTYFVTEKITDEATIEAYLRGELDTKGGEQYYFFAVEKPDNRAIDSLFDRAFGKAAQTIAFDQDKNNINVRLQLFGPGDPLAQKAGT